MQFIASTRINSDLSQLGIKQGVLAVPGKLSISAAMQRSEHQPSYYQKPP